MSLQMSTPEKKLEPVEKPQRAVVLYRTKPLGEKEKWSELREREIDGCVDSHAVMYQFYARPTWPAMTGMIEVKQVIWLGADGLKVKEEGEG